MPPEIPQTGQRLDVEGPSRSRESDGDRRNPLQEDRQQQLPGDHVAAVAEVQDEVEVRILDPPASLRQGADEEESPPTSPVAPMSDQAPQGVAVEGEANMDMGMDDGGDWGWDMDEDWDGAMSGVGQSSPDGSDDSESEEENVPRVVDRGSLESPSEERLRPPARQEVVLRDDAAEGRVPRIERVGHSEEEEEEEDSEEEGIAEIPDREEEGSDDGMMADSFTSDEEAVFPPLAPEEEADGGDGEEGEQEDEDGIFSSVSKLYSLVSTGSLSHTSQKRLRHVAQQLQNVNASRFSHMIAKEVDEELVGLREGRHLGNQKSLEEVVESVRESGNIHTDQKDYVLNLGRSERTLIGHRDGDGSVGNRTDLDCLQVVTHSLLHLVGLEGHIAPPQPSKLWGKSTLKSRKALRRQYYGSTSVVLRTEFGAFSVWCPVDVPQEASFMCTVHICVAPETAPWFHDFGENPRGNFCDVVLQDNFSKATRCMQVAKEVDPGILKRPKDFVHLCAATSGVLQETQLPLQKTTLPDNMSAFTKCSGPDEMKKLHKIKSMIDKVLLECRSCAHDEVDSGLRHVPAWRDLEKQHSKMFLARETFTKFIHMLEEEFQSLEFREKLRRVSGSSCRVFFRMERFGGKTCVDAPPAEPMSEETGEPKFDRNVLEALGNLIPPRQEDLISVHVGVGCNLDLERRSGGNPFLASMHTWLRVALLQESSQSMDAQHVGTFQEFTAHGLSALGDGSASSSVIPELAMAVADVDPSLVEDFYVLPVKTLLYSEGNRACINGIRDNWLAYLLRVFPQDMAIYGTSCSKNDEEIIRGLFQRSVPKISDWKRQVGALLNGLVISGRREDQILFCPRNGAQGEFDRGEFLERVVRVCHYAQHHPLLGCCKMFDKEEHGGERDLTHGHQCGVLRSFQECLERQNENWRRVFHQKLAEHVQHDASGSEEGDTEEGSETEDSDRS